MAGVEFKFANEIIPERDENGSVRQYLPQSQYSKATTSKVHKHGAGPFCRFSIKTLEHAAAAVYVITVDSHPQYVGETVDAHQRFGPTGYGLISPRNCYKGGQSTNCKINNFIYAAAVAGREVSLWVHYTTRHKLVEAQIRAATRLPWNSI